MKSWLIRDLSKGKPISNKWWLDWNKLNTMPGHLNKPYGNRNQGSKKIHSLYTFKDDQVFIGFGDADLNDGNTDLVSVNPATGVYTTHEKATPTEAFKRFKSYNNILYALYIDPVGYWEATKPFSTVPNQVGIGTGSWVHCFDMTYHNNRLWVFGSSLIDNKGYATATWSEDAGKTWNQTIVLNESGDFHRATNCGINNGTLWCVVLRFVYEWNPATSKWVKTTEYIQPADRNLPPGNYPESITCTAETSTHWVIGTYLGDIYTRAK